MMLGLLVGLSDLGIQEEQMQGRACFENDKTLEDGRVVDR